VQLTERHGGRIRIFSCQYHYTMFLHSHSLSLGGWTIGPSLAAFRRRNITHRHDDDDHHHQVSMYVLLTVLH
jgi:hypothetical protein